VERELSCSYTTITELFLASRRQRSLAYVNFRFLSRPQSSRSRLVEKCQLGFRFLRTKQCCIWLVTLTQVPRRCGQSPSRIFRKLQPLRPGPQCHSAPVAQYRARDTNLVRKPSATQTLAAHPRRSIPRALVAGLGTLNYGCEDRYAGDVPRHVAIAAGLGGNAILLINGEFRAETTQSASTSCTTVQSAWTS